MKKIIPLLLTFVFLLGSVEDSWCDDSYQKGLHAYQRSDFGTALREWRNLAEQGNADAQLNLGGMYGRGEGISQSNKIAAMWYELAAKQGNTIAQTQLGILYAKGEGVPRDYVYAYMWWYIAAANGDKGYNDQIVKKMTPEQIREAKERTKRCIASNYKNCRATAKVTAEYYDIGEKAYMVGLYKVSYKWWRKAAGEGDTQAQANLSDMYRLGRGVSQNNIAAYVWANMAVRNGHKQSTKLRDDIAKKMTSAQLKIAKDLSLVCVKTNYKGC